MSEKQSTFTVTDRRKFTLDGELRDPASAEEIHETAPAVAAAPEAAVTATPLDDGNRCRSGPGCCWTVAESDLVR